MLDAGWTIGVDATLAWAHAHRSDSTLMFVDAPLVVLNEAGQRLCEKEVGVRYGRWKVSANSTNSASPRLAGTALIAKLEGAGWTYDDGTAGPSVTGPTVCECYPYTTTVGAVELGYPVERPLYKRKPRGLSTAAWRTVRAARCDVLIERIARLADAFPRLDLRCHPVTADLIDSPSPLADKAYKHREDLIDACLAAWTALLWATHGLHRCQVLGADDPLIDGRGRRATIIAPARPEQRAGGGATGIPSEPLQVWPTHGERLVPRGGYLKVEIPEEFTLEIRDRNRGPWHPWAALRAD